MNLDDVGDATHGERVTNFLNQMTGGQDQWKALPMDHRGAYQRLAESLATAEMLDEVHVMLRTLIACQEISE